MEDRHYLSEPRPIPGLVLPTWDVDVLREGVDVPILTLRVDSDVLPPRQRKKKVVWKLPDTMDQVPKFGKEDKLRILELFKQQKKTLKREKRKSQDPEEYETNERNEEFNPSNGSPDSSSEDSSTNQADNEVAIMPVTMDSLSRPPGFESLSLDDKKHTTVARHYLTKKKGSSRDPEPNEIPPPPPGLGMDRSMPSSSAERDLPFKATGGPPPGIPHSVMTCTDPPENFYHEQPSPSSHVPLHDHPPRYFQLPSQSNDSLPHPTTTTTTVELGQFVTQAYYFMLSHGHVPELKAYYSPFASKSLTVGGAHAVCASKQDIELQLQSLVGTIVAIRGVLQQPIPNPSHPDSILVVITGMCVRPHALPFCHSIVLVPIVGEGYQIQNDALCFLTTEAVGAL